MDIKTVTINNSYFIREYEFNILGIMPAFSY